MSKSVRQSKKRRTRREEKKGNNPETERADGARREKKENNPQKWSEQMESKHEFSTSRSIIVMMLTGRSNLQEATRCRPFSCRRVALPPVAAPVQSGKRKSGIYPGRPPIKGLGRPPLNTLSCDSLITTSSIFFSVIFITHVLQTSPANTRVDNSKNVD